MAKYQKTISSKGDIIVHTYGSKLRDVVMPYPPNIEEQKTNSCTHKNRNRHHRHCHSQSRTGNRTDTGIQRGDDK